MKNVAELMEWLPSIPIFGGLEAGTLERVVALLGEHHVKPDEEICRQGDSGRAMFVVREGEVVICRDTDDGRRMKMVRMGAGEFFGEMTLIDIQKRSATVVATKPSILYSLGNRDLYSLYQKDVAGYVMVLQNICRELSRRLRVTNARLQELASDRDDEEEKTLIRPAIKRKES